MTDAELNVIMKSEGFKKVGDEIDGMTSKLNKLRNAFEFLTKLGEKTKTVTELGDALARMSSSLYTDKYIAFNETLYKTGLIAGKTKSNLEEYRSHLTSLRKEANASAESFVKLAGQMRLTVGFAGATREENAAFMKTLYQAGITDENASRIMQTVASLTSNSPEMVKGAMSGDKGTLDILLQQAGLSGNTEAIQNIMMLKSAGNNMGNREMTQAMQNKEAAKANKELALAEAGKTFSSAALKFGAWVDGFVMAHPDYLALGIQGGAIGRMGQETLELLGLGGGGGGGSSEGGGGGGKGGLIKTLATGAAKVAVGLLTGYAANKMAGEFGQETTPRVAHNESDYNPMLDVEKIRSSQQRVSAMKLNIDIINKTAEANKAAGATDLQVQDIIKQKMPIQNKVNEELAMQLSLIKSNPYADKTFQAEIANQLKSEMTSTIELSQQMQVYHKTLQQIDALELNPKRIQLIKATTDDKGLQLDLVRDTLAAQVQEIAGLEKQKEEQRKGLEYAGLSKDVIKARMQVLEEEILAHKTVNKELMKEYDTTYAMTGGMKTTQFKWAQDALTAVSQLQTTLPTALGSLLETRKGLYNMAIMERDRAHEGYLEAINLHYQETIIQDRKMDYLNKANKAAQEFMALTGGLTDQIQMALGELHDVSGGFEETAPKLAEQGMIVRRTIGDIYAPMFKYGGYGSEGAVGSDIFTKTFSSMTNRTSFGLGTAEGGIEKQLHVIVDNPEAIGDNIKPINIGRKS